jgi:hypothetical protein
LTDSGFRWGLSFAKNSPIQSEVHLAAASTPLLNLQRRGDMFDRIHASKTDASLCTGEEFMLDVMLGANRDSGDSADVKNAVAQINGFLDRMGCNAKGTSSFGNLIVAVAHSFLLVACQFDTYRNYFSPYYAHLLGERSLIDASDVEAFHRNTPSACQEGVVLIQLKMFMRDVVSSLLYSAMFAKIERDRSPEGVPADKYFGGRTVKDIKAEICEHNRLLLESLLDASQAEGAMGVNKVATARVVEIVEKIADQWKDIYGDYSAVSWLDMQGMWIALSALVPEPERHAGRLAGFVQQQLGVDEDFAAEGGLLAGVVRNVVDTLFTITSR